MISGELVKELKTIEFRELPQSVFNAKMIEKAQKEDEDVAF